MLLMRFGVYTKFFFFFFKFILFFTVPYFLWILWSDSNKDNDKDDDDGDDCYIRQVALRCDAPYTRHCDVDVHFHLNRACAGRRRCAVPVSATVFGDPCGYDEFLVVTYRCTPGQWTGQTNRADSTIQTFPLGTRGGVDPGDWGLLLSWQTRLERSRVHNYWSPGVPISCLLQAEVRVMFKASNLTPPHVTMYV